MDQYENLIEQARGNHVEAARSGGACRLDLAGLSLGSLPESLGELTAVTELDLVGNQLTALPEWLGNLTALTRLGLSGNQHTPPMSSGSTSRNRSPRGSAVSANRPDKKDHRQLTRRAG